MTEIIRYGNFRPIPGGPKGESTVPFDRLAEAIRRKQNPTVVGLDPNLQKIPDCIKSTSFDKIADPLAAAADAVGRFNRGILDAVADIVPAVKPQCAYYEALGWPGVRALAETIAYAREKGLFVITDGKRNDIGATMEAYAAAHLGRTEIGGRPAEPFGADALTVNGYLGTDGIAPLLPICRELDKGIFVLVRTSNPSAGEVQDQLIDGEPLYERMGRLCEQWSQQAAGAPVSGYGCVGAVVGATWPRQLSELRRKLPHTFFLVPGYGAQGAGAADIAGAFDAQGGGAVVNSSRAILYAWQKEGGDGRDFAGAARRAALRMKEEIGRVWPHG